MLSIRHYTCAYMVNGTPITVNHAKSMPFNILSTRKPIPFSSSYLHSEKIEWFKYAFHSHLLKYNHTLRTFLQCMSTELLNSPDRIVESLCTVTSYRMYYRFQFHMRNRKTSCFPWVNYFHYSSFRCCRCCSSMSESNLYIRVFCSAAYNSVWHCFSTAISITFYFCKICRY